MELLRFHQKSEFVKIVFSLKPKHVKTITNRRTSQRKEVKAYLNELKRKPPDEKNRKDQCYFLRLFKIIFDFFYLHHLLLHTNLHLNADLRVRKKLYIKT